MKLINLKLTIKLEDDKIDEVTLGNDCCKDNIFFRFVEVASVAFNNRLFLLLVRWVGGGVAAVG